jgi:hypothetical protein
MSTFRRYIQSSCSVRQHISPKHHKRCQHPHGSKIKKQILWWYLLVDQILLLNLKTLNFPRPPLWSSDQSSGLQIQRSRVRFPALPDFLRSSGSGTGSTQSREESRGSGLGNQN